MSNESQQDPINLNINIPVVVNRHDNRSTAMNIENAEHVTHMDEQPSVSQATSSLLEMPASNVGQTPRKPTLQDIFAPDIVGGLLQFNENHEAYFKSCRRLKFTPVVVGPNDLVNHYRCCMLVEEVEEAIRTKDQLKMFLGEKFQTTPDEFKTFADTVRDEGSNMKAILFYQVAAELYGNRTEAGLDGIVECVSGIKDSITTISAHEKQLKSIVGSHLIPLMRNMREMIQQSDAVSQEDRCLNEVWCLFYTETCEISSGDLDSAESTLKEAIAMIERVFQENAAKNSVYGHCLVALGNLFRSTRPSEAILFFRNAISAFEKAEDVDNAERAGLIEEAQEGVDTTYDCLL